MNTGGEVLGQVKNVLHPDKVKDIANKVFNDYIKSPLQKGYTYFKDYTKKLGDVKTPLTYEAATPLGSIKVPKTVNEVAQDLKESTVQMAKKLDEAIGSKGKGDFDVTTFEKSIVKMNINEKIAFIRTTAADIAKQRNWKKDSKLTKQNGRDVYFDPGTRNYYALDTQHGRFEVVNKKGKHQGEVDFNLNSTKPADKSGGHDLKVK